MMDTTTIETLLGQRSVFEIITKNINEDNIFLIRGETGCGKSYLLNKISGYVTSMSNAACFKLTPNILSYDYAPFLAAISQKENKLVNLGVDIIKSFSEMIPAWGDTIDKLLSIEIKYPSEFSDTEINIISQIKVAAQGAMIMLLCEDISSWDEPSLVLLWKLFKYRNELGHFKLCCVCTDSVSLNGFDAAFTHICELKPFKINDSVKIVRALFPYTNLDNSSIENICSVCKCNIGIVKLIISNMNSPYSFSDREVRNAIISTIHSRERVSLLLDKASLIGVSSYKMLLRHFLNYDSFEFQYSINEATDAHLLKETPEYVVFANECVWSIFNNYNKDNKKYHYDLATCIKSIMPTSHKRIGGEYILAGLNDKAAMHYVLSAIYYYITYRIKPIFTEQEKDLISCYDILEFCNQIIELYESYYNGVFDVDSTYPSTKYDELNFEVDYLKAFVFINLKIERTYYENMYNNLWRWVENNTFKEENPEQWLRAAYLCLETGVELHKGLNKSLLCNVQNTIDKYIKTDRNIELLNYDFKSKSNSIFSIEIAANETFRAVSALERNNSYNRYSYKYLIFLTNALANAIVIGKEDKAFEYTKKAMDYIRAVDVFPHYFIGALNNNILLTFMLWNKDKFCSEFKSIEQYMIKLISQSQDEISKVLYKNNLSVFYLYHQDINAAEKIFEELYQLVEYNEDIDDYYSYLIKNNYYLFCYFKTGKIDVPFFIDELSALRPLDLNMKYFNARIKYMKEKLSQGFKLKFQNSQWNDFDSVQVGEAWFFWGKWFLMSDIQFWSE